MYPVDKNHRGGVEVVDPGTRFRWHANPLSQPARWATQRRRRSASRREYATVARQTCPSLADRRISPHVLRHTTAMELMQAGVDRTLIALWLGHESAETTQIYLDANLTMKEEILLKTTPISTKPGRYRPGR